MMLIRNLDIDPSGILLAIIKLLILCFLGMFLMFSMRPAFIRKTSG